MNPNNSIPLFPSEIVSPSPDNDDWKTGFADIIRQTGSPRVSPSVFRIRLAFYRALNIRRLSSGLYANFLQIFTPPIFPLVSAPSYLSSLYALRRYLSLTSFIHASLTYTPGLDAFRLFPLRICLAYRPRPPPNSFIPFLYA